MRTTQKLRMTLALAFTAMLVGQMVGTTGAAGQSADEPDGRGRAGGTVEEEGPHGDPGEDLKVDPATAEATDVGLHAQATNLTPRQVRAERRTADRLGRVQEALRREFPEDFAGAHLADEPGTPPTIRFAGKAPRQARRMIERENLDATLVEHTGHSLAELQGQTSLAVDALTDADFRQIMGYVDQRTGQLVLEVTATAEASSEKEVRQELPPSLSDYEVVITIHEEDFLTPEHTRGGAWMRDDGTRECTAGWSAERISDGLDGIATAAHCLGLNQYEQPGYGVYSAPWKTEHIGDWGEMEWHTTSHWELAEFFARSDEVRDVYSVESAGSISVGESVCVYGRSSNSRACDLDVDATDVSVRFSYAGSTRSADRMVMMDGDRTIAGDSGGGWSWGTRAYGIHFGDSSDGRNLWSVADYLDEAIGVRVLTK